jgi:hypothetical protein
MTNNQIIIRAKWTLDGCKTLEDCAKAFEEAAESFRRMAKDGLILSHAVEDDYGFVDVPDKMLEKYKEYLG